MPRPSVLCAGIVVADVFVPPLASLPIAGELRVTGDFLLAPGGCAANTAIVLSRLGIRAAVAGKVGEDVFGDFLEQDLRQRGIDTGGLSRSSERPRDHALSGRRRRRVRLGLYLPERDELEAIGDEGSVFLDDPWHCREPVILLRREGEEQIAVTLADSYRLELENLSDAIRGGAEPLLGREDAVGQARTIEGLYRSAAEGIPVKP